MDSVYFCSVFLPYCLQKQANGSWVVLNRKYQPIGPVITKIDDLTLELVNQLSVNGADDIDAIYLYNDGTNPTISAVNLSAYANKLALLAKLRVFCSNGSMSSM